MVTVPFRDFDLTLRQNGSFEKFKINHSKTPDPVRSFSTCSPRWMHYATNMKSLHIRDVPEQTIERLKRQASRHHRSLQGELQCLLDEAAKRAVFGDSSEFSLHTVKTQGNQDWSREGLYED
jgi:hypothetical protein